MGHTIVTIFLTRSYCKTYSENPRVGFCLQQNDALVHRARHTVTFLQRKVPYFGSPTLWSPNSPDLNPEGYRICSAGVMQEKLYQSRIANVNGLEMRLIDERGRFDQSIVDAAIAASGAVA